MTEEARWLRRLDFATQGKVTMTTPVMQTGVLSVLPYQAGGAPTNVGATNPCGGHPAFPLPCLQWSGFVILACAPEVLRTFQDMTLATKYETVIGLEVHAQLLTRSKMFCACPADYVQGSPNSVVCPVCLAMPGVLPVINRRAVECVIMTGLAPERHHSRERPSSIARTIPTRT